ncbi:SUZ domain-containing protein 1 [Schistosoma japonicum]|nr:SUZ domain-containing protein 1 [Schistosoma japonicum]KAH8855960.1 SUZ domain-containing protein 1 [Schistosoma japonicum]
MEHPPIRILRRPCPVPSDVPKTTQRPPVVTKTLEQREADYAAARKRIMGSATPEQENVETKEVSEKYGKYQFSQRFVDSEIHTSNVLQTDNRVLCDYIL